MKKTSLSMQHFVHLGQVACNHMFDNHEKKGPQGCFAFFLPWFKVKGTSKVRRNIKEKYMN